MHSNCLDILTHINAPSILMLLIDLFKNAPNAVNLFSSTCKLTKWLRTVQPKSFH